MTGALSGTAGLTERELVRLACSHSPQVACDGWAIAAVPGSATSTIARVGSAIITARLGAIIVAVEAIDVAVVSMGNRLSALDAKGGCRSNERQRHPIPLRPFNARDVSAAAVDEDSQREMEPTGLAPVGARPVPMSLSWQGSHNHHSWTTPG